MSSLDELLGSYLDLARHLDPLRHPHEAPAEVHGRLGRYDAPWLEAQAAALKSIANAVEDLGHVEALDDEVDRTMLINTMRGDLLWLGEATGGASADPGIGLRHANAALDMLLGEDFDAVRAAALRARVAELPGFLAALRTEARPAAPFQVVAAQRALEGLAERLDVTSERIEDEALLAAALQAVAEHRDWLLEKPRGDATMPIGLGPDAVLARLTLLSAEPVGLTGTNRVLELRRAGVERSLVAAADELGYATDWRRAVDALPEIAELDPLERLDAWHDEWQRIGAALGELGITAVATSPPPAPAVTDRATLAAWAVRAHAAAIFEAARALQTRAVRRLLVAPGIRHGWQRTVAALLRETAVLGSPERRLASAALAVRDAVAAEADLALQSRRAGPDELATWAEGSAALDADQARDLVAEVAGAPLEALAAALAHEAWQGWFAEDGGDPAEFLRRALDGGGLAVALARWAIGS